MLKMMIKTVRVILGLGLLLSAGLASAAYPAEPGEATRLAWEVQRVDDMHHLYEKMGDHAALYDSAGVLHVAFGGDHLYYARCENANCAVETVDPTDYVGMYASLALDSRGRPNIAYYDVGQMDFCDDEKVKHAAWDGSQWIIQVVDQGCTGKYPSIAMDELDVPHISYFDEISDELKLADWDGTAWNAYTPAWLPAFEFSGYPSSLLADASGNLHLAFVAGHPGGGKIWHTQKTGGTWSTPVEVDAQAGASGLAMTLDGSGKPHVSYNLRYLDAGLNAYVNKLRYSRMAAGVWLAPVEIDDMDYLGWTSITVGIDGFPHVAYKANGVVAFATKTASGWEAPVIAPGTDGAERMYAGHAANNKIGVVYYSGGTLQLVTSSPPQYTWSAPMEIDATGWVGERLAMTSSAAGDLHIIYSDQTKQLIRYAHRPEGGDWAISAAVTITGALTLRDMDLALDASGFPHIVYQEYNPVDQRSVLKYLQWTGSDWLSWGVVNQAGHNGCVPSLALGLTDRIYIAYNDCDYIHENLTLAVYDGSWSYQTVDPQGDTSGASIQVTDDDYIYISYSLYDYPNSLLRYAKKEGTANWVIEDVTPAGPQDTSLVLDSSGKPRIGYIQEIFPDYAVEFAYWDGQGWYTDTVTTWASQGEVRLVIDAQDRPHLAFICWGNPCLAVKEGSNWVLTDPVDRPPADPDVDFGRTHAVGIGFGSQGLPVMAYDGELDLKLAELLEVEDTWWAFMPALER